MGAALRAFFVAAALWKAIFEKAPSTAPPPLAIFSGQSPRRQAENTAARLETPPGRVALLRPPGRSAFSAGKSGQGERSAPLRFIKEQACSRDLWRKAALGQPRASPA